MNELPPPTRLMRTVAWVTTRDWLPLRLRTRILGVYFRWLL